MFSKGPGPVKSSADFLNRIKSSKLSVMNRKSLILLSVIVLLTAVLIRGAVVFRNPMPAGDGMASHVLLADNLNRGLGFTTFVKWTLYDESREFLRPEANRQPAMAFLLAAVFTILGTGYFQAQLAALAAGLAAMVFPALWARKLFGRETALIVLAYLAVDPPFVWFAAHPDSLLLYVALFYGILILSSSDEISWKRAALLGALTGVLYLVRTQGALMVPSLGLWILLRGGSKKWLKAFVFGFVALVVVSPWLVRNMNEFGSPAYSQNGQFLLNENHWSAWSVRETAPSPSDMWKNQGPLAVAQYAAAGVLRVFEPFTTGSTHRGEIFGQPTLAVFIVFGIYALFCRETRKRMLLPALVLAPVFAALILHQHSGRYLSVAVPAAVALGGAGMVRMASEPGRKKILLWVFLLITLTLAAPLFNVLRQNSSAKASEAMEASAWLEDNASDSQWVCTYPNVELFHYIYRKPTLAWPNDYEMLLWPYLEEHDVQYMVVDRDLSTLRPWLSRCWRRSPDGASWDLIDPPPFLGEVFRTASGNTIIYEFTGPVPEGYMAVDSLPPDNYRAIGPH